MEIMNLWRRLRRKRIPLSELKTADIMASKSSLEHSVDSWEASAHVFTALVAIGLIIEYRDPFVSFLHTHDWSFITKAIGGVLVTLGVAGEFITGLRSTSKDGELREANSILASRAAETIAASNLRIAELHLETETLRKDNAETKVFLSDRRIPHFLDFEQAMYQFPGTKFMVELDGSNEARELTSQLRHCLVESGWMEGNWVGTRNTLWEGVYLSRNKSEWDADESCGPAGEALADWLESIHIPTITIPHERDDLLPGTVLIQVGPKPRTIERNNQIKKGRADQKQARSSTARQSGPLSPDRKNP